MHARRRILIAVLPLLLAAAAVAAIGAAQSEQAAKPSAQSSQAAKPAATASSAPAAAPAAPSLSDQFAGLEFRNIGPFRGGRVTAVAGVRDEPLVYYFGATGGGVWKTIDGGANWKPISDKDFKTGSVGAIGVAESDPNVIYAGMGEAPIRGNVSHGDGVYKSTDAGRPGRTSACRTRTRSRACASTRRTRTSSTSPRWATSGARTRTAASTARATAARPGRRSSSSTTRPARRTS